MGKTKTLVQENKNLNLKSIIKRVHELFVEAKLPPHSK